MLCIVVPSSIFRRPFFLSVENSCKQQSEDGRVAGSSSPISAMSTWHWLGEAILGDHNERSMHSQQVVTSATAVLRIRASVPKYLLYARDVPSRHSERLIGSTNPTCAWAKDTAARRGVFTAPSIRC
jgi:hypothetical protein